jgi:hypothetical protein
MLCNVCFSPTKHDHENAISVILALKTYENIEDAKTVEGLK